MARFPLVACLLLAAASAVPAEADAAAAAASKSSCPSLPASASTYTTTSYVVVTRTAPTSTATDQPQVAGTVTRTGPAVVYETGAPTTVTGSPVTVTTYVFKSAKKTVTMPTKPGFTAVSCEAAYRAKTVTKAVTTTYTTTPVTYITNNSTVTIPYYTKTVTDGTVTASYTQTYYTQRTKTVTTTVSSATSTVYAACATNNVVSRLPNGYTIDSVSYSGPDGVESVDIESIDAQDCCNRCQANSTCAFSAFSEPHPVGVGNCQINYLGASSSLKCRGSSVAGTFSSVYERTDDPYYYISHPLSISNGPCGQADPQQ